MRLALLLTILLLACGDDASEAPCERSGVTEACECDGPVDGYQVCLDDGSLSDCVCQTDRTTPCSAVGAVFSCRCSDDRIGVEYCLDTGRYSECDCVTDMIADAGATTTDNGQAVACPSPYTCTEQMGVTLCTDAAGVPPLCDTASDCVAAGMPDADCIDPGVGITLCAQFCQL